MHARVTTFEGAPEQLEEGIRVFRAEVIPWLSEASGFRGWIAMLDPDRSRSLSVTFWTTADAAHDHEASGGSLRQDVVDALGITMRSLDVYELAVAESLDLEDRD